MSVSSIGRMTLLFAILVAAFAAFASAPREVTAEPYVQGPGACKDCHRDEYQNWKETKHFTSYRTAHRAEDAEKINDAVGGGRSMKRNKTCTVCHYSTEQRNPEDRSRIKYGPSCESCHGASSVWQPIHFDYGGANVNRESETSDHKTKRIADTRAAGMVWASMNYDIAAKCMRCHGLARAEISGEAYGKMLEAGHPLNQSFDVVMFSQGLVRHWREARTPAKLARLYIAGQAAKLVIASEAAANLDNAQYAAVQMKRANDAKAVLQSAAQAAVLIQSPSDANARKMMQDIGQQDLSGAVDGQIPCAGPDKANLWQC